MKTAEEWIQIYNRLDNKNPRVNGWIQQIQLDALKEGMRRAAEVADDKTDKQMLHLDCFKVSKAILTAAEQLTEKDL